jgi:hypothetical protein
MGREVKRVALNFNWPIDKIWEGYVNPFVGYQEECSCCGGSGLSPIAKKYNDQWYGNADFSPDENGSQPITPDNEVLIEYVTARVDKSIKEAKDGKVLEFTRKSKSGHSMATFTGTKCWYTSDGTTREEAIRKEIKRLCNLFNSKWSNHLNDDDIKILIKNEELWSFTRRPRPGIPLEKYIETRAYYLWVEAGRPESDGKEFWEKSAKEHNSYWLPFSNNYVPTREEVQNYMILTAVPPSCYSLIKARCQKNGHDYLCKTCDGDGRVWPSQEIKEKCENWEQTEPPAGEGYQIWETVSEGSPISPVFADPQELAEWMHNSQVEEYGEDYGEVVSTEGWFKFITGPGWAPSAIIRDGQMLSGVQAAVENI